MGENRVTGLSESCFPSAKKAESLTAGFVAAEGSSQFIDILQSKIPKFTNHFFFNFDFL